MNIDAISIIGKSRFEHITSMLQSISKLPSMDGLEFEITVKDLSLLDSLSLVKTNYSDTIVYDIVNDINIAYRYYPNESVIERKILLQKSDITDTCLPLIFRYSKEDITQMDTPVELNDVSKYIRKQRFVYKSMLPALSDWKIEKTVRFFTNTLDSTKITTNLDESNIEEENVYDIVDLEFEYTGESKSIIKSISDLLSTLFPSMFKYLNTTYGRISGILKTDTSHLTQKVSIITQSMIDETPIDRYMITEKIDGERSLLVVFNGHIYCQTSNAFKEIASTEPGQDINNPFSTKRNRSLIIVDTEFLDGVFYAFDILYNNGKPSDDYSKRSLLIDSFIVEYGEFINIKRLSNFTLNSWSDALDYINTNDVSKVFSGTPIDGIILRDGNSLYKFKNRSHLTVDFLIRYNYQDDYCYLFTIGDPKEVITEIPFTNQTTKMLFGYHLTEKLNTNSAYILADFPYINSTYKVRLSDHEKYDGKITEMLLSKDGSWEPIRIREDKEYPNGYKIVLSLYGLMSSYNDTIQNVSTSGHGDRNMILKRLYPTFIHTSVNAFVLTSDAEVLNIFSSFHSTLGMLYIASKKNNTITNALSKLSASKVFYNKDIKGLQFIDYQYIFNSLLSKSDKFYKHTLNYIIINDIYEYAPSYIDLYALCNFLTESISMDGIIMIYFDLTKPPMAKATKATTIGRMIGSYAGNRKNATWTFKVGSSSYYASVPDGFVYQIPFKDILLNNEKIRAEMTDNIIRYDNYLSVLRSYFNVTNTILTEQYIILSLEQKDR